MTTDATPTDRYIEVQQSAEFTGLRRKLRNFVFPMTVAFFLWYALYVLLSAYARGFMSVKLVGNINVALLFGLLQFVSTFLIAWYYSRYAAKELDPVADRIGADLAGGGPVPVASEPQTTTAEPQETTTTDTEAAK
ncbi:DUF485 domain-containing protein [Actinoplanes sp. NPDC051475]|uniref:DUF485 domain-containing protein n=1 Tax=Actinoplanes sp. NPDC051475 TaxID=3157225 RepID=UPI00345080CD